MRKNKNELMEVLAFFISSMMIMLMTLLVVGITITKSEPEALEIQSNVEVEKVEEVKHEPIFNIIKKQGRIKNASILNIREKDDIESSVQGTIHSDEIFYLNILYVNGEIDIRDEWYQLHDSGHYVSSEYIELIETEIDISEYKKTTNGTYIKELPKIVSKTITTRSNLRLEDMKKITKGTSLESAANAIIDVENKYGINAFFTYAVAALESSYGNSAIARSKNNLFGMNAVDSNPNLAYAYSSKSSSINDFGKRIYKYYIKNGRTTISSINERYSTDKLWHDKVYNIMQQALDKID